MNSNLKEKLLKAKGSGNKRDKVKVINDLKQFLQKAVLRPNRGQQKQYAEILRGGPSAN